MIAAINMITLADHLPKVVFAFAFGATVGSFINVVVYRLPTGMSVITPPSRCPTCGARLAWWENLPILGWILLRARCRRCHASISVQYVAVELLVALLFVGLYLAYYAAGPRSGYFGGVGGDWWYRNDFVRTWPLFVSHLGLIAALVAMTLIDARTFTIPIQIPLTVTIVAFVAAPLQMLWFQVHPPRPPTGLMWPMPGMGWGGVLATGAAMIGILGSTFLLRRGTLTYSFADYEKYVPEGQTLGDYPHARREMVIEVIFLIPCMVGLVAGLFVGVMISAPSPPHWVQAVASPVAGYLMGGGLIWGIRIVATLAFGREAMGIGDIHLLGAIGAVLGFVAPVWVFFLAPFSGLAWILVSKGLITVFRTARREVPYGPHLAVAAIVVIVCQPWLERLQAISFPFLRHQGFIP